jgi:hypothetical protein
VLRPCEVRAQAVGIFASVIYAVISTLGRNSDTSGNHENVSAGVAGQTKFVTLKSPLVHFLFL